MIVSLIPSLWASFAAIKASYVEIITRVLEPGCRDFLTFSHKSISEVECWCLPIRPHWQFNPPWRCWMRLSSVICAGQSSVFTQNSKKRLLFETSSVWVLTQDGLFHRAIQKRPARKYLEKGRHLQKNDWQVIWWMIYHPSITFYQLEPMRSTVGEPPVE